MRYTDGDKQTKARPRLHARRRAAERVPRAQENIVTTGCTRGGGSVRDEGWVTRAAPRDPCRSGRRSWLRQTAKVPLGTALGKLPWAG